MSDDISGRGSALRSFLLSALVITTLFAAGAGFLVWKAVHPEQAALSRSVTVHLTKAEIYGSYKISGSNKKWVEFTYSYDGHRYAGHVFSYQSDALWRSLQAGQDLPACVDPDEPTRIAPLFDHGRCGEENLHVATAKADQVS